MTNFNQKEPDMKTTKQIKKELDKIKVKYPADVSDYYLLAKLEYAKEYLALIKRDSL
jgi:hypothetical protein